MHSLVTGIIARFHRRADDLRRNKLLASVSQKQRERIQGELVYVPVAIRTKLGHSCCKKFGLSTAEAPRGTTVAANMETIQV